MKWFITADCTPSDCDDGMQPKGLRLSTMCARVRETAEMVHDAPVLVVPEPVADGEIGERAAERQLALQTRAHLGPRRRIIDILAADPVRLGEPQHVHDPGADRLDHHLRALALEEAEHPEVAVALGGLRPELPGDLHHRLHAQAVDLNRADALARRLERLDRLRAVQVVVDLAERVERVAERPALAQPPWRALLDFVLLSITHRACEVVHHFVHHAVCLARAHLERTDLVGHVVEDVAEVERAERPHAEVHGELQARLARGGPDAVGLLKQEHPEPVEARVLHAEAVLRLVHAEAARAARSRGEEHVVVDDLLAGEAGRFQMLEVLDQMPDGEIRRIALAVVAVLLAELERGDIRRRQNLHPVAGRLKGGLDEPLVLRREPAEQDRDAVALGRRERPLNPAVKVLPRRLRGQPRLQLRALRLHAAADFGFNRLARAKWDG
ncbi:MAG: hypothetical protein HY657_05470 [Acidobacteria bacterium]|nr:hypothetical protein [Acidobacteriota bacterium]